MTESTTYRIAFILPQSRQLIGMQTVGGMQLPLLLIPSAQRPAEQLTKLIRLTWHVASLVLDILGDTTTTPCAVIEVRGPDWPYRTYGLTTLCPDDVSATSLSVHEKEIITSILSGDNTRTLWNRIGWIEEVKEWIRDSSPDRRITFSDEVVQLNAGGNFVLVRLDAHPGPAYWLKAVGEPNTHEYHITKFLTTCLAKYLPPIVTLKDTEKAWVMEEVGQPLQPMASVCAFDRAVSCIASLQTESIPYVDSLLSAGCADQRLSVLQAHMTAMTLYLEEAMEKQTSAKVAPLATPRLLELKEIVIDACARLLELEIPDTLIHNDINPGNILIDGSRCVLTDWAEACIGNPFVTFQRVCAQVATSRTSNESCELLKAGYAKRWNQILPKKVIDRAFALSPVIAIVSYLYGKGTWLADPIRYDSRFESYSRSIARHMDRAARSPEFMEALCH